MHEFTPPSPLPRILLVEDHDLTRRMQVRFLSRSYSVDFATTAEEAYQMAFQRPYAVIVMDLNLSGPMSGYALMQHLRATPTHRTTPMVAVTAHQQPGEREALLRAGFDLYLSKPFRWQAFAEAIRAAASLGTQPAAALPGSPPPPAPPLHPGPAPAPSYPAPPTGVPPYAPQPGAPPAQIAPSYPPQPSPAPPPPMPPPPQASPPGHGRPPGSSGMPASAPSPWDPPPGSRPIDAPGAGPRPWGNLGNS